MRPDEKSVMTYISLFWKEFAANKRKNIAGERIGDVVRREQALEDLSAQYVAMAEELARWGASRMHPTACTPPHAPQAARTGCSCSRTHPRL